MTRQSLFFDVSETIMLNSIDAIIELSHTKSYGTSELLTKEISSSDRPFTRADIPHETSGLFRGQAEKLPLIPSTYRGIKVNPNDKSSDFKLRYAYVKANHQLNVFCKNAILQNKEFPTDPLQQMVIAQHYGIKTPLLDWTKNIFAAIYFALDLRENEEKIEKNFSPFIYHIENENILNNNPLSEEDISLAKESLHITPAPIDRRIERQFSTFTFHPHPSANPIRVPVKEYRIDKKLFIKLWKTLEGLGLTSAHFFPDYSGLADRIKNGYML